MKRILCLVLFMLLFIPQSIVGAQLPTTDAKTKKEILNLKQQISYNLSGNTTLKEKYYKHQLALQQVKLLKLTTENFILQYHPGTKYPKQIKQFVDNSFECAFIFPTLGEKQLDVFIMYQRWAEAETCYNPNQISVWTKGQKIKQAIMNRRGEKTGETVCTIKFSSRDAGILQVNSRNVEYVKGPLLNLYKSGIIPFKIKTVRRFDDLLDVNTNLVARSLIEVDRKDRGWEYKHYRYYSMDFYRKLRVEINNLKAAGLYDPDLVQKYYYLNPIKTYS